MALAPPKSPLQDLVEGSVPYREAHALQFIKSHTRDRALKVMLNVDRETGMRRAQSVQRLWDTSFYFCVSCRMVTCLDTQTQIRAAHCTWTVTGSRTWAHPGVHVATPSRAALGWKRSRALGAGRPRCSSSRRPASSRSLSWLLWRGRRRSLWLCPSSPSPRHPPGPRA